MSELPDLWVDPKEIAAARAEGSVWAVQAHNCQVVNQDARYVPADRIATLTRKLEEAQHQRQTFENQLNAHLEELRDVQAQLAERTREKESAERQVEKMRERLMAIRDSTYRNAITLRGMADAALTQQETKS